MIKMTDEQIKNIQRYVELKGKDYDDAREYYMDAIAPFDKEEYEVDFHLKTTISPCVNDSDLEDDFYHLVNIPTREEIERSIKAYIIADLVELLKEDISCLFSKGELKINGEEINVKDYD